MSGAIKPGIQREANRGSIGFEFMCAMLVASLLVFGMVEVTSVGAVEVLKMSGVTRSELRPLHACVSPANLLGAAQGLLEHVALVRSVERGYAETMHPARPRLNQTHNQIRFARVHAPAHMATSPTALATIDHHRRISRATGSTRARQV